MRTIVRLEEFGMFLFSIYLFSTLEYAWWVFPLLLFVPDLSMVGYLRGSKLGAAIYNCFHFRALALLLFVLGVYLSSPLISLLGIMLFAHSSLDRAFGYGLKFGDSFGHTHLGMIGREKREPGAAA